MKQKPLFFTILTILCLIEPLIKILYFKAATEFDFSVILGNILSRTSVRDVFDFWLVFPVAGILLIKLRKWTYFAFMTLLGYIIYNLLTYEKYTWPYNTDSPLWYHYFVVAFSAAVLVYLLLPETREPFFNKKIRWWENKARYQVNILCKLKSEAITFPSEILNISGTGAFLKDSAYFKAGDQLDLEFTFHGQDIVLPVEVISKHEFKNVHGYGVRFVYKSFKQNVQVSKIVSVVKRTSGIVGRTGA